MTHSVHLHYTRAIIRMLHKSFWHIFSLCCFALGHEERALSSLGNNFRCRYSVSVLPDMTTILDQFFSAYQMNSPVCDVCALLSVVLCRLIPTTVTVADISRYVILT